MTDTQFAPNAFRAGVYARARLHAVELGRLIEFLGIEDPHLADVAPVLFRLGSHLTTLGAHTARDIEDRETVAFSVEQGLTICAPQDELSLADDDKQE